MRHNVDPIIYHAYERLTEERQVNDELVFAIWVIVPIVISIVYLIIRAIA